jgi:hypothetical protein
MNDTPDNTTLQISDLIIGHPQVRSFDELKELVKTAARAGAVNLVFDLKPEYTDTPRNWQDQLEAAFCSVIGDGR